MKQVKVKLSCANCGSIHSIYVDLADLQMWQSGASFIEDAMPYIPQEDREFFMSGLCPACYPRTDFEPELADEYEEWLTAVNEAAPSVYANEAAPTLSCQREAMSSTSSDRVDGELYGFDQPDYSNEWMITFNHLDNKHLRTATPPYIVKFEIFGPNPLNLSSNVKHFSGWMTVSLSNTPGINAPLDHCRAYHGSTYMVVNGEVFS